MKRCRHEQEPTLLPSAVGLVKDPETLAEWQEAADSAFFFMLADACLQMVTPEHMAMVNFERCDWLLDEAKKRGITAAHLRMEL